MSLIRHAADEYAHSPAAELLPLAVGLLRASPAAHRAVGAYLEAHDAHERADDLLTALRAQGPPRIVRVRERAELRQLVLRVAGVVLATLGSALTYDAASRASQASPDGEAGMTGLVGTTAIAVGGWLGLRNSVETAVEEEYAFQDQLEQPVLAARDAAARARQLAAHAAAHTVNPVLNNMLVNDANEADSGPIGG